MPCATGLTAGSMISRLEQTNAVDPVVIRQLRYSSGSYSSSLLITIKSHKDPGQVVPRPIHCCNNHLCSLLGKWIGSILRPRLSALEHLHRNTDSVLSSIRSVDLQPGDIISSGDVKDFYYSGEQYHLAKLVGECADPLLRNILTDAVLFCLSHQFVNVGNLFWRVRSGSSQGFTCSGEILDWAFYSELEEATVYNTAWRQRHGTLWYGRYRDDTLWLIRPSAAIVKPVELRRNWNTITFKVDKWSASQVSLQFLDVEFFLPRDFGHISFAPFFKPSSLGVPLSVDSHHPQHTHRAWVLSELRRFARRSSSHEFFVYAKRVFISRLSRFHHPAKELRMLQQQDPYTAHLIMQCLGQPPRHRQQGRKLALVLPYHSALKRANISSSLSTAFSQLTSMTQSFWQMPYDSAMVAWRLGGPHLQNRVRSEQQNFFRR